MKTKAAVLYELNSPLRIAEIDIPLLKKGQVLIKMLASGICRSQLNEIKGLKGPDPHLPHLLGHEGAGIVEEIGEDVTKVNVGDYVVLSWIKGNGLNSSQAVFKQGNKSVNAGPIATFTEYGVVSENRLTKISKTIPDQIAALLGCAVLTGIGIIRHNLPVDSGESIIIFGVGGIGSSVILGALLHNLTPIIAVDINQRALDFACYLGATQTIIFNEQTIRKKVKSFVGEGVEYAVEASGSKQAMEKALEVVKPNGTVLIAGNISKNDKICLDPFELIKGKKIIGTWGGNSDPDIDIPFYEHSYSEGKLPLDKLITKRFTLDQINEALELMEQNQSVGRMIITF